MLKSFLKKWDDVDWIDADQDKDKDKWQAFAQLSK
jgi:hypothetical protein